VVWPKGVRGLPAAPRSEGLLASEEDSGSVGDRARRGAMWSAGTAILLRLSNVLVMVIVARIISPKELGVYTLATVIYGLVSVIGALGAETAITRLDLDADELGPTVTTVAICCGFITGGSMAAFAEPLASLLGSPEAAASIRILAISAVLTGLFAVPVTQNVRLFRQDVVFRGNAVAFVVSSVALLLLVNIIPGAEAFAWSRVVGHVIVGLIIIRSLNKRYRPSWRGEYILPLLRFGAPAALGTVLSQLILNTDYVIVGRELSARDLGLYALAFNIASWPTSILFAVIKSTILPGFSAVRHDDGNLRSTVSRAVRTVGFVACPIGAFTCAFAYPLIETLYGSKWLSAAPVMSILAPYGVLYVMTLLFDNIMIASGKTLAMCGVQVAGLIALVPALLVGVRVSGLAGAGIAHIVVIIFVMMPVYAFAIFRITGAGPLVFLRALSRPIFAAAAATGIASAATFELDSAIGTLAVAVLVGCLVYVAVAGRELLQILPPRVSRSRIVLHIATWPYSLRKRVRRVK
jgi:lipopolysaccharide exporter